MKRTFDHRVAPRLVAIESEGTHVLYHLKHMQAALEDFPARPVWDHTAQSYLKSCRDTALTVAAMASAAIEMFENPPVYVDFETAAE